MALVKIGTDTYRDNDTGAKVFTRPGQNPAEVVAEATSLAARAVVEPTRAQKFDTMLQLAGLTAEEFVAELKERQR